VPFAVTALTLTPAAWPGVLGVSLIGKALGDAAWTLETRDIRDHGVGQHRAVDDTPSGGGPGMVLRADVAAAAIDAIDRAGRPLFLLTPRGTPIRQSRIREIASGPGLICFCGRFEGLDERVIAARGMEEVSVGDVVLSGGDVAAQLIVEACVRLLPGVMGASDSGSEESFENGLLEYPHYTRPRSWEGHDIPDILSSGDHKKIAKWRREQSEAITAARRPDLLAAIARPATKR
jgi:tRNA (guanine37-N1)-methyltransferase